MVVLGQRVERCGHIAAFRLGGSVVERPKMVFTGKLVVFLARERQATVGAVAAVMGTSVPVTTMLAWEWYRLSDPGDELM